MIKFKEDKDLSVGNDSVIAEKAKNRRIAILQLQYLLAHYVEDIEDVDLKEQARNIVNNLFINTIRDGSMKVESKKFMQVLVPSDDDAFKTFEDWVTIYNKSYGAEVAEENDMVNNPGHYQSRVKDLNIDAITCMRAAFGDESVIDFCICNALKYIYRHQSKNGKQDIQKAIWYLNKYLELSKD